MVVRVLKRLGALDLSGPAYHAVRLRIHCRRRTIGTLVGGTATQSVCRRLPLSR